MAEAEELDEAWYSRPDVLIVDNDEGNGWVLRASSIGGCPVGLAYSVLSQMAESGYSGIQPKAPDEWLQGAMDESAALEQQAFDLWVDTWEAVDPKCKVIVDEHTDLRCSLSMNSGDVIEGTIDFAIEVKGEPLTVEIKVVGAALYDQIDDQSIKPWSETTGLVRKYRTQVGVYRWARDKRVILVVAEKANGALTGRVKWHVYDGSDTETGRLIPSKDDLEAIIDDVQATVDALQLSDEAPEGVCAGGGDPKCKWSDWCVKVHRLTGDEEKLLTEYLLRKGAAKMATDRLDDVKAQLSELSQRYGRMESTDGTKVTWVEQHVPEKVVRAHDRKYMKVTEKKEKDK